ncbi:MFS transporter [Alteromonadaceae bacterium M269]|nr:MFS transporter [Alteromonadaceae bacterium M269]
MFGVASGFPWIIIGSAMTAWLKDEGLSRSAIGLFGLVFTAYTFNFCWSPLLDKIKIPILGQRRGWIFSTQLLIILGCIVLATIPIQQQFFMIALVSLGIAISSATQDIAIDAYRIDIIKANEHEKMTAAASVATAGWWTGYGGLGAIPFFVVDSPNWNWNDIYYLLAAIMAVISVFTLLAKEPTTLREKIQKEAEARYQSYLSSEGISNSVFSRILNWLLVTLFEPFREFFQRNGVRLALSILLFIFLFKIGEAFLGKMSLVFYKELGFSNSDIGAYSKLVNWWVTIIFSVLGGMVNIRYGIVKGLLVGGIAMAGSNLMFSAMAIVGPNKSLFLATIIVDGFTAAWGTVAMVAFISLMCNSTFSASQYALMASISNFGRTLLASTSGILVDWMDGNWSLFFIITALMVIPSLLFLWSIRKQINHIEEQNKSANAQLSSTG